MSSKTILDIAIKESKMLSFILSFALGFIGVGAILLGHYIRISKLQKDMKHSNVKKEEHMDKISFSNKLANGLILSFLPLRVIGYIVLFVGSYALLKYQIFNILGILLGVGICVGASIIYIKYTFKQ